MTTALSTQEDVRQLFDKHKAKICEVSKPYGLDGAMIIESTKAAIEQNPNILKCTTRSVLRAILAQAQHGLTVGGITPQGYIIPYGDEAKFQPSYRGYQILAERHTTKRFVSGVVRPGDVFEYERKTDGTCWITSHKPTFDYQPGEYLAAFACAEFKDGTWSDLVIMNQQEIEKHGKQFSTAFGYKDSPWKTKPAEMAEKTVIKRLIVSRKVPLSSDDMALLKADTEYQVVNATFVEPAPVPEPEQLPVDTVYPAVPLSLDLIREAFLGCKDKAAYQNMVTELGKAAGDDEELQSLVAKNADEVWKEKFNE